MKYTARFAHLAAPTGYVVGDIINPGHVIGRMGSSGQSTAAHLHLDVVHGWRVDHYTLSNMEGGDPEPSPRQCNFFIDRDLFRDLPVVTTYYADPEYQRMRKKVHLAYDVVPEGRHRPGAPLLIYWNRSMIGHVLAELDDPEGYGHCLYVGFEA